MPSSLILIIKFWQSIIHPHSSNFMCKLSSESKWIQEILQAFKYSSIHPSRRSIVSHWRIQSLWSPLEDPSFSTHPRLIICKDQVKIGVEDQIPLIGDILPSFYIHWSIPTCGFEDLNPLQGLQHKWGDLFQLLCLCTIYFNLISRSIPKLGFDQGKPPIQKKTPFFCRYRCGISDLRANLDTLFGELSRSANRIRIRLQIKNVVFDLLWKSNPT